jgi:hypothetical protein
MRSDRPTGEDAEYVAQSSSHGHAVRDRMVSREDKNRTAGFLNRRAPVSKLADTRSKTPAAWQLPITQTRMKPPSAPRSWPVIQPVPGFARATIHDDKSRGTPRRPNGSGSARPSPRFHRQYSDEKLSGGCERMDDPVHRAHGRKVLETSHRAWRHEPREDFPSQCGREDRIPAENYNRARAMSGS